MTGPSFSISVVGPIRSTSLPSFSCRSNNCLNFSWNTKQTSDSCLWHVEMLHGSACTPVSKLFVPSHCPFSDLSEHLLTAVTQWFPALLWSFSWVDKRLYCPLTASSLKKNNGFSKKAPNTTLRVAKRIFRRLHHVVSSQSATQPGPDQIELVLCCSRVKFSQHGCQFHCGNSRTNKKSPRLAWEDCSSEMLLGVRCTM